MYIHTKVKNTSTNIQYGKLKINEEVLGNNHKIIGMKWFIVKVILNATIKIMCM